MKRTKTPRAARVRRHIRVRKRVSGTGARPRLCVFRSLSHIYAQVIDDVAGVTIAAASDVEADLRAQRADKKKLELATLVGGLVAQRAKEKGVSQVVFDRGGFLYHGRVAAVADAARSAGLDF